MRSEFSYYQNRHLVLYVNLKRHIGSPTQIEVQSREGEFFPLHPLFGGRKYI